jgi:uncharacterized protein (TIGR03790 family)
MYNFKAMIVVFRLTNKGCLLRLMACRLKVPHCDGKRQPLLCFSSCSFLHSFFILLIIILGYSLDAFALLPEEVAVVANSRSASSMEIAHLYMTRRLIPKSHLIVISTPDQEVCSREAYDKEIAGPIRKDLIRLREEYNIRGLVTIHGVPLKIGPTPASVVDEQALNNRIEQLEKLKTEMATADEDLQSIYQQRITQLERRIKFINKVDSRAAVDSELALVLADPYPLAGWQPNPFHPMFRTTKVPYSTNEVLIVSRLDGPDKGTVERLINDSLEAEKNGLNGSVCLDARWDLSQEKLDAYKLYDQSLHNTAEILARKGWAVTLDSKQELMGAGRCEGVALYAGWYSLANFVDAFTWQQGAVGYHIASSECRTLRDRTANTWCVKLLEDGAAATLGPVYEPYLQAFPLPDHFFSQLTQGYLSLGETYLVTLPYLSWQIVLVGDPLYRPFMVTP